MMKKLFATALAVGIGAAGTVFAGGSFDSTGTITGQSSSKVNPIHEGHLAILLSGTQDKFTMKDPDHPFANLAGTCMGAIEVRGPAATGGGICAYQNEAGDAAFVRFTTDSLSADGAFQGDWTMIGGTGGMSGITGGGRYASKTDPSNGKTEATLTGAVSLP